MDSKLTVTTALITDALRHVDTAMCETACRACPEYGRRWGCPPHSADLLAKISTYKYITLVSVTTAAPADDVRKILEPAVICAETTTGGYAAAFAGKCPYCHAECSRISGRPCRHPDMLRPSLEAIGFNVFGLVGEMQGITFDRCDGTLTLTAAVAHDCDPADTCRLISGLIEPLLPGLDQAGGTVHI